jgi:hypothetical protein
MSLAIITTTNEGNILAADSMETYKNVIGDTREGSQTRMKLFQLNARVGAVACGLAHMENKNIEQHMIQFARDNDLDGLTVQEITDLLYNYFAAKYQSYLKGVIESKKKEAEAEGYKNVKAISELECVTLGYKDLQGKDRVVKFYQPIIEILVAGYDMDGTNNVFKITLPDPKEKNGIVAKLRGEQSGATWIGQTDVLIRIIRGWSPEIKRVKLVQELPDVKRNELMKMLDDQEYLINWGTMTLQDAIEFSNLAIKTTESIQRITDGTWQLPGASPGVGGPVDIAVITPKKGFVWIQKKHIHIGKSSVDLDSLPDIKV